MQATEQHVASVKKPTPHLDNDFFTGEKEITAVNGKGSEPPLVAIQKESYHDKFLRSIMDHEKDYPLPVPVLSIQQNDSCIPFLTLKSFSLWQGKQKSKKTTALALAVAAFLKGKEDNCIFR